MEPFKFVHTADLHLDTPFSGMAEVNREIAARLRDATLQAFDNIVALCLQHEAAFLLVAGDIYDAKDRSLRAQLRFRDGLSRLSQAGVSTFVVHGNHDPLNSRIATIQWPKKVHVFGGDGVSSVPVHRGDEVIAEIYGISYATEATKENLVTDFHKQPGAPLTIGLLHCSVGQNTRHEPYAPCSMEDLVNAGMDYWALGHFHAHGVLSNERPTAVYSGNPQGRHPGELGPRGCYLVEVSADGRCTPQFVPVDAVRWSSETIDIENLDDDEAVIVAVRDVCTSVREKCEGRPSVCRITLTGRGPAHHSVDQPGFLEDLTETIRETECRLDPFVWVERIEARTGAPLDIESLRMGQDFVGEFLRMAADSRERPEFASQIGKQISKLYDSRLGCDFLEPLTEDELRLCHELAESQCLDLIVAEQD